MPLTISLSAAAFALEPGDMVRPAVTSRDPHDIDAPVHVVSLYADAEHPPYGAARASIANICLNMSEVNLRAVVASRWLPIALLCPANVVNRWP